MLIPRFSLKLLLVITTVSGLIFFIATLAIQGADWAIAVTTAIAAILTTFLLHVAVFTFAWLLASMRSSVRTGPTAKSPFATAAPPDQILPPPPVD